MGIPDEVRPSLEELVEERFGGWYEFYGALPIYMKESEGITEAFYAALNQIPGLDTRTLSTRLMLERAYEREDIGPEQVEMVFNLILLLGANSKSTPK